MKISKKSPQFEGKTGLIIVCSGKEADFYLANDGEIQKAASFKMEKIKFSDREDFAGRGSMVFESGAKFEALRIADRQNFIKGFSAEAKKLAAAQKIDSVYLFAPGLTIKDIQKSLPALWQKKLHLAIEGNFQKAKLDDILKKIIKKPLK
jgi:hypothetical protein